MKPKQSAIERAAMRWYRDLLRNGIHPDWLTPSSKALAKACAAQSKKGK